MITTIRRLLIRIGKVLPFVLCAVVLLCYVEAIICMCLDNFVVCDTYMIADTRISFAIGNVFEYGIMTLLVLAVLSFAIESCIYAKCAILYLGLNLYEKSLFSSIEVELETAIIVSVINAIICGYFTYKGIRILTNSQK